MLCYVYDTVGASGNTISLNETFIILINPEMLMLSVPSCNGLQKSIFVLLSPCIN